MSKFERVIRIIVGMMFCIGHVVAIWTYDSNPVGATKLFLIIISTTALFYIVDSTRNEQ